MKLNKLILSIALIIPLFASSCKGNGGKYSGLSLDAQEMIYAYSQISSTTITISDSLNDVEFVDDFKGEYFTFDNVDDFKGKGYTVSKTTSKKLTVTFTGAYNGTDLSKSQSKEIKYKISKTAFKNNVLIDDATGKIAMSWDNVHPENFTPATDSITIDFLFTQDSVPSTNISLSPLLTSEEIKGNISDYCLFGSGITGTVKFSRHTESDKIYLRVKIEGLPSTGQRAYQILIPNKTGAILFDNLPENHGLSFRLLKDNDDDEYHFEDELYSYFDKLS